MTETKMKTKMNVEKVTKEIAKQVNGEIRALVETLSQQYVELGRALARMKDGKLYELLGYGTWKSYCRTEVGISAGGGYSLVRVGRKFAKTSTAKTTGLPMSKLVLIASTNLSEAKTEEFLQEAKEMTFADVSKKVRKVSRQRSRGRKMLKADVVRIYKENFSLTEKEKGDVDAVIEMLMEDLDLPRGGALAWLCRSFMGEE